jgi:Putative Ig domain
MAAWNWTRVALTLVAGFILSGCPSGGGGDDTSAPPAGESPIDVPPDTNPPVDTPPIDDPPVDTPPVDEPPDEDPPVDTPPNDEPPDADPPVDTPPDDEPPDEDPPVDAPPVDEPPDEDPPVDTPPADDPPDEPESDNSAPSLSGTPSSSTKVGEAWSFTPNASDADGDALTFAVENQPAWTDFNANNGALSGEPQEEHEGTYPDVAIIASDGMASDSLTFSLTVTRVAAGSVTVSWVPPTLNDDGSSLTDLASFKIHYGKSSGNYSEQILIENPGISTYLVENLTPDTYYFVTTAINSGGIESEYSEEAVVTIN